MWFSFGGFPKSLAGRDFYGKFTDPYQGVSNCRTVKRRAVSKVTQINNVVYELLVTAFLSESA